MAVIALVFACIAVPEAQAREVNQPMHQMLPSQLAGVTSAITAHTALWTGKNQSSLYGQQPKSSTIGIAFRRFAGDGYFDAQGTLFTQPGTIIDTDLTILVGSYVTHWLYMLADLTLRSRTLESSQSGVLDIQTFGLADSHFEAGLVLWRSWRHELLFAGNWKPPTGRSDIVLDDGTVDQSAIALGNNIHEGDLMVVWNSRAIAQRLGVEYGGFAGYRFRGRGAPVYFDGTLLDLQSTLNHEDLLIAGLSLAIHSPHKLLPMPFVDATWLHPVAPVVTNLWSFKAGLQLQAQWGSIAVGASAPIYGKGYPDPFPLSMRQRQSALGIASHIEALWHF